MRALDWAAAMTVVLIWALNFVIAKVGVGQLPPLFMLALRFSLVAVLLLAFLRRLGPRWRTMLIVSMVMGLLHFGLLFTGLRGVDAGPAAIAIQLAVPFSALLAWLAFGERMAAWQLAGLAIAFAGVYVLAGDPSRTPSALHFAMVVVAAFAWAAANIFIKRLSPISPFVLNAWLGVLAAPQLFLASLVLESGQFEAALAADWRGWGAVVFMALGASITGYGLWYYLIGKYEVTRVVPLMLLSPVLAVLLAAGILAEPLTVRTVLGGLVTIAGVAMIQFLKPGPRRAAAGL